MAILGFFLMIYLLILGLLICFWFISNIRKKSFPNSPPIGSFLYKLSNSKKGESILLAGVAITVFNIFNFSHVRAKYGLAYYYSQNTLFLISFGAVLITLGILIIKKGK